MKRLWWILTLIVAVAVCAQAADWRWQLDDKRYKQLTVFERAQVDKASELFRQKNYRTAASEFEKFKIQFEDSSIIAYVLFMRAYSLHQAKDRNAAIKYYNEVLDYFGDEIGEASAALYHLGMAHLDNGDVRQGMEAMQEMADDEDYQKHPLAAGAIRRLGDNYWKNKQPDQAVKYWKQVVRDFMETGASEARAARASALGHYIKSGNYAAVDQWLVDPERRDDPEHRSALADIVYGVAWSGFGGDWEKYTQFNRKDKEADMQAFFDYFARQKDWYMKQKRDWDYYYRTIQFLAQRGGNRDQLDPLLDEVAKHIAAMDTKKARDDRYSWIIDRLREGRQFDRARYCIAKIAEPGLATYKEYEVLGHGQGQWHDAAKKLIDLAQMGDADWQARAEDQLAWVYKDRTQEYDKAIQMYTQINRPPGTLWGIQDCYRRQGKLNESLQTLTEIENMFPEDASRAAWHKASYYREAGNRDRAIAQARRILTMYKESSESSYAHQMLEEFGVETGGGVVDKE